MGSSLCTHWRLVSILYNPSLVVINIGRGYNKSKQQDQNQNLRPNKPATSHRILQAQYLTVSRIFFGLAGLVRNKSQPHFTALSLLSSVPKAESTTIVARGHDICSSRALIPFVASKPSSTGMEMSMKIRSKGPVSRARKASIAS